MPKLRIGQTSASSPNSRYDLTAARSHDVWAAVEGLFALAAQMSRGFRSIEAGLLRTRPATGFSNGARNHCVPARVMGTRRQAA